MILDLLSKVNDKHSHQWGSVRGGSLCSPSELQTICHVAVSEGWHVAVGISTIASDREDICSLTLLLFLLLLLLLLLFYTARVFHLWSRVSTRFSVFHQTSCFPLHPAFSTPRDPAPRIPDPIPTFSMAAYLLPLTGNFCFKVGRVILSSNTRDYLNNRVFLSRNYRLIVAPRKFDVLKTNICPRSEASRANMLVLRTSNFQGATIRPIVPRQKHSIVFIVHL